MATTLPCSAIHALSFPKSLIGRTPYRRPLSLVRPILPTDRFLDAQLGDLRALQRQAIKICRRLEKRKIDCLEGNSSIDVLSAPILNDTLVQIRQIEQLMDSLIHEKRQSLRQAHASRLQLLSTQGRP